MDVYVVVSHDDDSREAIEAVFTKKTDAEAYIRLLDEVDMLDFNIQPIQLDAPHTLPGVIGFSAYVVDGSTPSVTAPILIGRAELDGDRQAGRYDAGMMKGMRYARAEAQTHAEAIARATAARDAVGKIAAPRKSKMRGK